MSITPGVLPTAVVLIGCGDGDPPENASPQTMGFKAYNLLRMAQLQLPVPPAFVLGTHYCTEPAARARAPHPDTWGAALMRLQERTGRVLGDARRPLLLSVRSGAPISMPGMMETLLNIGLSDETVPGMIRQTGNPRLVWDAYRRLVATHGEVVAGVDRSVFEHDTRAVTGERDERDLDFFELRELTRRHLDTYQREAGAPFPQQASAQLSSAVSAVLDSWHSPQACEYRRLHQLPDVVGTAVTVQAMVFGNGGGRSGAGVGFTRDPATGEPALWVDFMFNAQGEDVVSGRRSAHGHEALADVIPHAWMALQDAARQLERALGDMQDFEFTVQDGQLFMLQTRNGKRTPQAAARIALDLRDEGVIDTDMARARTASLTAQALTVSRVVSRDGEPLTPLSHAASASNGVAVGEVALSEARARDRQAAGASVVLVRRDADTSDIVALECASGLLTAHGARTSHAAVVARQLGKVCLVGCADLHIDEARHQITIGDITLNEGDLITLDGNEGALYAGAISTRMDEPTELLQRLAALHEGR